MHADVYKKAVADFRATLQGSVAGVYLLCWMIVMHDTALLLQVKRPPQSNVSVNVRVRPLFDHEAIRGTTHTISSHCALLIARLVLCAVSSRTAVVFELNRPLNMNGCRAISAAAVHKYNYNQQLLKSFDSATLCCSHIYTQLATSEPNN